MRSLLCWWKTKPTTVEQLESLDKEIKELEEFRHKNQHRQKQWMSRLLLYSFILFLMTSTVVSWLCPADEWLQAFCMALQLVIYSVFVWFIRKARIFLFNRSTKRNNERLEKLKCSKTKILEEVRKTYENAKMILEHFDSKAKKKADLEWTPEPAQMSPRMRQGAEHINPQESIGQEGVPKRPIPLDPPSTMGNTPPPGARPPDRGVVRKLLEYMVGEGPQNRYAMICKQCCFHNGMALKEKFEYLAFTCTNCNFMNPARKTRPMAPRLPEFNYERKLHFLGLHERASYAG